MASVELSADVPISPQDTWDHVSELSELGEWLVIHEGCDVEKSLKQFAELYG